MRRLRLLPVLLAAVLLAGQWLAALHDGDHALQPGATHGCVVCAHAHGPGAGAVPHVPAVEFAPASAAPDRAVDAEPRAALVRHHPIRGPPPVLA